jgi:hypothetical protein
MNQDYKPEPNIIDYEHGLERRMKNIERGLTRLVWFWRMVALVTVIVTAILAIILSSIVMRWRLF